MCDFIQFLWKLIYIAFSNDTATTPKVMEPAELWLLGSSNDSAKLAAEQGLPYVFAHFINYETGAMEEAITLYREQFQPSAILSEPKVVMHF